MSDMKDRVMQVILAEANVEKGFIPDHAKNKFSDNSGNLKCPFCQRKLKTFAKYKDGTSTVYCSKCNLFGDSKLFLELIRTHKALDVAVDALKELRPAEKKGCYLVPTVSTTQRIIDEALAEITALEQKE